MIRRKLISFEDAAALLADNAIVSVSSSAAVGCPDAMLGAIGRRFAAEGHPRNLMTLHPIAAGDMYGVTGIDHIARKGLLSRTLCGSYPSGPSSKPMPKIWRMILDDQVAAYNVPSGILFDMHRDAAAKRPGHFTKVGIDTYVDPSLEGCAMNASAAKVPIVHRRELDGDTWLYFPSIAPDAAIIRATTADERGNLTYEHEGALLGGLDLALAARNNGGIVIAQVKRVAAAGSLPPKDVVVPGNLVDFIVVDAEQTQATETVYDPVISGEITRPWSSFEPPKFSVEKVIARRTAMELRLGQTAALGFGISAYVPQVILEEGLQGSITWAIEQGSVGGIPLDGFAFGCTSNADAVLPSPSQFTYFQGGGFDVALLSFLEIDTQGNVNVSKLAKKPYLTAGCGGFVDIACHARKIVFSGFFEAGAAFDLTAGKLSITKPGKFSKFVDQVEQITFSGQRAIALEQDVQIVTERCVISLDRNGLTAVEIMPGIDPYKQIEQASQGRVKIAADAKSMPASLLQPEPMGLRL